MTEQQIQDRRAKLMMLIADYQEQIEDYQQQIDINHLFINAMHDQIIDLNDEMRMQRFIRFFNTGHLFAPII